MFVIEVCLVFIGVNWIIKENKLSVVVIDSYCLVLCEIFFEIDIDEEYNIVIFGKSLFELNKFLDDVSEFIEMIFVNN